MLSPEIEVLAVQYPGRQDRRSESCIEDVESIADCIVAELRPWIDLPFALFGHSMGATIAFEVVRRLEEIDIYPTMLFVSARPAPSRIQAVSVDVGDDAALVEYLRKMSGTDSRVFLDNDILQMVLPTLRSDLKAAGSYIFKEGPLLRVPISAHVGDCDPNAAPDDVAVWSAHSKSSFEMTVHRGGHFYLNEHLSVVADSVVTALSGLVRRAAP